VSCSLAWLTLAVAAAAVSLSALQARELSLRAPLPARPFADALTKLLLEQDFLRAQQLCDALRPAWGAELASRSVSAHTRGEDPAFVLEETSIEFRIVAERHLYAIRTLGRIAIPLALGIAIVELGLGFDSGAAASHAVGGVQSALQCAARAVAVGLTTAAFCQVSVASLQRQAQARLAEVRLVSAALTSQMRRKTR
jgi:hypothetical protein